MRVWVDMSAPAHVLVLRPIIARLRDAGHEVSVTSREYTQTQQLLELHVIEHTPIGRHGGASRVRKLIRLMQRTLNARLDLPNREGRRDWARDDLRAALKCVAEVRTATREAVEAAVRSSGAVVAG